MHEVVLTLDSHVDVPLGYMDAIDAGDETELQVDLPKLESGQIDATFLIAFSPQAALNRQGYAQAKEIALQRARSIHKLTEVYSERAAFARSASDVRQAVSAGKRAILLGMENAYPLGESLDELELWASLGISYCGLTHIGHNQFADSSDPLPKQDQAERHGGLSLLGRELIAALNDLGIMVDVSHSSRKTMMQAAEISRAPIIASHSGVMARAEHPRNLDDEQLRVLRECGGVAQMVALSAYVKALTPEQVDFRKRLDEDMGIHSLADYFSAPEELQKAYMHQRNVAVYELAPRASVADFVDHIDHAVEIAGIDHVGIASDFDGGGGLDGWCDASEGPNVTAELQRRGYSKEAIGKIWGENLLRVMESAARSSTPI